jgi:hypothetical protein
MNDNDRADAAQAEQVATTIVEIIHEHLKNEKGIAIDTMAYGLAHVIAALVAQLQPNQQFILLPRVIDAIITQVSAITSDPAWMFFDGRPDQ